jgi:hypothetical protein
MAGTGGGNNPQAQLGDTLVGTQTEATFVRNNTDDGNEQEAPMGMDDSMKMGVEHLNKSSIASNIGSERRDSTG